MAIINCPKCKKQISEHSSVCIYCNTPVGFESLKKSPLDFGELIRNKCSQLGTFGTVFHIVAYTTIVFGILLTIFAIVCSF